MAGAQYHVSLRELTHVFTDGRAALTALSGLSLDVPEGQFAAVLGPSGCGKSTLLRIVGGLLRPSQGDALVHGLSPGAAQKARDIGYVFQDPALLPWRSVVSNVRLPLEMDGLRRRYSGRIDELLDLTGLSEFRSYHPQQLSGGMQQRVALARALVFDPGLLLMDEPFAALDEITRLGMRYELLRVWESQAGGAGRKTVLFVTHSVAEALALADRVIVLSARPGRIKADVEVELPRPRTEEVERSAPFLDYAEYLRAMLKEESP
jgi:NitT/TauT family transport system ATP-binding protein